MNLYNAPALLLIFRYAVFKVRCLPLLKSP